jgi:hypothetical protein
MCKWSNVRLKLLALLGLLLIPSLAFSQTVTFTGNLVNLGLAAVTQTNSYVSITLRNYGSNIPRVNGVGIISTAALNLFPNSSGVVSGNVIGVDQIIPQQTWYTICVFYQGVLAFPCANYAICLNAYGGTCSSTGSTFNLNSAIPLITGAVQPPLLPGSFSMGTTGDVVQYTSPTTLGDAGIAANVVTTLTGIQSLTNKTLAGPTITGTVSGGASYTSPTITGTVAGGASFTSPTITSPTVTGTDTGVETLGGKTLTSPIIIGSPSGTGIPTTTLKKGSGSGNYPTTSSTMANVDGTNLLLGPVTIPTGWKMTIAVRCTAQISNTATNPVIQLFDTQGSTILDLATTNPTTIGSNWQMTLLGMITGDGNSHTVSLQFKSSDNTNTVTLINGATDSPKMLFTLSPSN